MELKVKRIAKQPKYTIGKLYVDGKLFCDTLEDTDRGLTQDMTVDEITNAKIAGETAIPTGTYNVVITYSPKFNKDLPLIENVKGFEGIRIHTGNRADQTEGCLLVGHNKIIGQVCNSVKVFKELMVKMQEADTITLQIV
jgi:hypothetical protein